MKIYFDMDGVLADFNRGVNELCGMLPSDLINTDEEQDKLMWDKIREVDHFYFHLEPVPGTIQLFKALYKQTKGNCEILTAVPKPNKGIATAGEDKKEWVYKYLGKDIIVNVVLKEEKKNFVKGKDSILVDDQERNIRDWEKHGGTGVLFKDVEQAGNKFLDMGFYFGKHDDPEKHFMKNEL